MSPIGVNGMISYSIKAPLDTHWRAATCAEFDCQFHKNGWTTTVDEATTLGARQSTYIRTSSGRHFTTERTEGGLTTFTFPPGQECFTQHRIPLERPAYFQIAPIHGGRAHGGEIVSPSEWTERFSENQDLLNRVRNEGS